MCWFTVEGFRGLAVQGFRALGESTKHEPMKGPLQGVLSSGPKKASKRRCISMAVAKVPSYYNILKNTTMYFNILQKYYDIS